MTSKVQFMYDSFCLLLSCFSDLIFQILVIKQLHFTNSKPHYVAKEVKKAFA